MEKADLVKLYKSYYTARSNPELITVEKASFITVCGKGDPSSKKFSEKVQALYTAAYGLKFRCKEKGRDFVIAKLEGQWWFDEDRFEVKSASEAPVKVPRSEWQFRLLIRVPGYVVASEMKEAVAGISARKNIPFLEEVELSVMEEGLCVQVMHRGPFDTEMETLSKIEEFMKTNGLVKNGLHHEIYLSDFRKTAPEKLRTILREPCRNK